MTLATALGANDLATGDLGPVRQSQHFRFAFENPDGSPIMIGTDYFGKPRNPANPTPGPFQAPGTGIHREGVAASLYVQPCRGGELWDDIPLSPSTKMPSEVLDDYWNSEFQRVNREVADHKTPSSFSWGIPSRGPGRWVLQPARRSGIDQFRV